MFQENTVNSAAFLGNFGAVVFSLRQVQVKPEHKNRTGPI